MSYSKVDTVSRLVPTDAKEERGAIPHPRHLALLLNVRCTVTGMVIQGFVLAGITEENLNKLIQHAQIRRRTARIIHEYGTPRGAHRPQT